MLAGLLPGGPSPRHAIFSRRGTFYGNFPSACGGRPSFCWWRERIKCNLLLAFSVLVHQESINWWHEGCVPRPQGLGGGSSGNFRRYSIPVAFGLLPLCNR